MLELDTFNHECHHLKQSQFSVFQQWKFFFSNKINILQHIKSFFSTIALAPGAPDGMTMVSANVHFSLGLVCCILKTYCHRHRWFILKKGCIKKK